MSWLAEPELGTAQPQLVITLSHQPYHQPTRESYIQFPHPDSYFILFFLVKNDNNYDNAIFYTGNIFLLWQGIIIQMLLLPMMMINNIKHMNISKPLCLNDLPLKLVPIYYEPIKELDTTTINYWLNHSFISPKWYKYINTINYSLTTCSRLVHNLFMDCSLLVHDF